MKPKKDLVKKFYEGKKEFLDRVKKYNFVRKKSNKEEKEIKEEVVT